MTTLIRFVAAVLAVSWLAMPFAGDAVADDGHDHAEAPASTGELLPRVAAASERFELVGVLEGRRLTLWLDRIADNAPVTNARIEVEIAGQTLTAEKHDDAYEVTLAGVPAPGVLTVTATVAVDDAVDRLVGEFDLHGDEVPAKEGPHWVAYVGWGLSALAVLAAFAAAARRLRGRRQADAGGAA